MAIDLSPERENFANAAWGADVRGSMVSLANKIETEMDREFVGVDDTLTIEGYGADAKKTGQILSQKADKTNPVFNGSISLGRKENTDVGARSSAVGTNTTASASASHAEGQGTTASAVAAHAEGINSVASNTADHAEGNGKASGGYSHAEGESTASGSKSHAENQATARGQYSHAEGSGETGEKAIQAHAEGRGTIANARYQHVSGQYNIADTIDENGLGTCAVIVGGGTTKNDRKNLHTLGWDGKTWFRGEVRTGGTGYDSGTKLLTASDISGKADKSELTQKADKADPVFTGSMSLNRKADTTVGVRSFAVGTNVTASGVGSHAEGQGTTASATGSHAEGSGTTASNTAAHAEGINSAASNSADHAEGKATASGGYSHAENDSIASGAYSHAENKSTATANYSHAENKATAGGQYSHAEGSGETGENALYSHAEGYGTIASARYQHVSGRYNIADTPGDDGLGAYAVIVGNGTSTPNGDGTSTINRSNAFTVDWAGYGWFKRGIELTDAVNGKRYVITLRNGQLNIAEKESE